MSIDAWYVGRFSITPELTTFARETASFYIDAKGRRTKKESRWYRYFTSEQDAKSVIHARDEMKRLEASAPELLQLVCAIVAERGQCFIPTSDPNDETYDWDSRANAVITNVRVPA